jgi:argininosuccinate lyase
MLWGSRFDEQLNNDALKFSSSLHFDIELFFQEIKINKAHAEMLSEVGIISSNDAEKLTAGLNKINNAYKSGEWIPNSNKFEDIHSAIEAELFERIGDTAGKLHTGRSRNDLAAASFRLWVMEAAEKLIDRIVNLQKTLLLIAENHTETLMPGYTHLQRAQPISLAFHLLAYYEMLNRSVTRLHHVKDEADSCPLGSGALAGSTLSLDRKIIADKLGFKNICENAMDAVSDRDFAVDFLNASSLGLMHLSRLSEELILWSTSEWSFIQIGDSFTTGSSLMPQKRNPDMAELIRGKSGRVFGNYISLLTTLKGLPLSYNRDLQEDKLPVFDSFYTFSDSLNIMNEMLKVTKFNSASFLDDMDKGYMLATDLADWLVLKGISFRDAHSIVGKVVKYAEENEKVFKDITLEELQSVNEIFDHSSIQVLKMKSSLERKQTYGSPNPAQVKMRIIQLKKKLNLT